MNKESRPAENKYKQPAYKPEKFGPDYVARIRAQVQVGSYQDQFFFGPEQSLAVGETDYTKFSTPVEKMVEKDIINSLLSTSSNE